MRIFVRGFCKWVLIQIISLTNESLIFLRVGYNEGTIIVQLYIFRIYIAAKKYEGNIRLNTHNNS